MVFIQNEIWKYCKNENEIIMKIDKISEEIGINKVKLYKALYINMTLTIIWNFEDQVEERVIKNNIKIIEFLERILIMS